MKWGIETRLGLGTDREAREDALQVCLQERELTERGTEITLCFYFGFSSFLYISALKQSTAMVRASKNQNSRGREFYSLISRL